MESKINKVNNLGQYEQRILNQNYGSCSNCNQPNTFYEWCQSCNAKRFQQEFSQWTSGSLHIDEFIQEAQIKARSSNEVIEWIPYDRLRDIQFLARGGFSVIYKAIWL